MSRIRDEVQVELDWSGYGFAAAATGPSDILEHGTHYMLLDGEPKLDYRKIADALEEENVVLSQADRKRLGLNTRLAGSILESIGFELQMAKLLKVPFVTEREIHLELLQRISGDRKLERRNQIIEKHLTCIVPFLDNVALPDILKLRANEGDAFQRFRKALDVSIDQYSSNGDKFTERDAAQLYSDVLAPELSKLNQQVSAAQKRLRKTAITKASAWAGVIGFGSYMGLVPSDLIAAAQALGLTKIAADILEAFGAENSAKDVVRSEDMYFLWKLKKLER